MTHYPTLFAAAVLAVLPSAAEATLLFAADVDGSAALRCTDNQGPTPACPGGDTNPAVGTISLPFTSVDGITLVGSVSSSVGTPANPNATDILNSSSLNIIGNFAPHHIVAAVGDTDFAAPVASFSVSTSFTAQLAQGTTVTTAFFDDALNRQGAEDPLDAPGSPLASFTDTVSLPTDAFSHSTSGPVSDTDPFSMTQTLDIQLAAGTIEPPQLVNRGSTEIKEPAAIPEPSSLVVLGTALAGFAWVRRRQQRRCMWCGESGGHSIDCGMPIATG
jgi:hypothetical protein